MTMLTLRFRLLKKSLDGVVVNNLTGIRSYRLLDSDTNSDSRRLFFNF